MLKRTAAACVLALVVSAGTAATVPPSVEVGPAVPDGVWLPCFPWWCPEPPDCPFNICA